MSKPVKHYGPVSADVERLRRERPHARPFVDPFMAILLARPPLVAALVEATAAVPRPDPDLTRLGQGACLEPRDEFPLDEGVLRRVFGAMHPLLVSSFVDARTDLLQIGRVVAGEEGLLAELAGDMLDDRQASMLRKAHSLGVEPKVMGFWCVQVLTPLAMARGRQLGGLVPDDAWNRGYCPVCGSWPGISRRNGPVREMTCSFCAATWRYRRQECPYCEAPGPAGQVYAVPGFESERVLACRRCNHYLAEIEGEGLVGMAPEVEALSLAPLEILARQHGHAPASLDWRQMVWV